MMKVRRDDKGMTLVELLAALAVSAAVMTGLASLLITSLKLSEKNNANAEVQSEVQTALSLLTDHIMEAEGIGCKVSPAGENTDCMFLGEIDSEKDGTDFVVRYRGKAVVADIGAGKSGNIWLVELPNEEFLEDARGYCRLASSDTEAAAVSKSMDKVRDYVMGLPEKERLRWLLARNITEFSLLPESSYGEKTEVENGSTVVKNVFVEPFTVKISLTAGSAYGSGSITRRLSDKAAVRNRINILYATKPGEDKDRMEVYEREW